TLSPALTALLLRPRDKATAPPLPGWAFALAGGWIGWEFLAPWMSGALEHSSADIRNLVQQSPAESVRVAAALVGAAVGGIVGWPLNRLLSACFKSFNAGFGKATGAYTIVVGGL